MTSSPRPRGPNCGSNSTRQSILRAGWNNRVGLRQIFSCAGFRTVSKNYETWRILVLKMKNGILKSDKVSEREFRKRLIDNAGEDSCGFS